MRSTPSLERFERLYDSHARFVAAVLTRLGVPPAGISDAVQDVFIVAYRHWGQFDATRPPRPWLVGITRRVAFRYRRSAHRQQRKADAVRQISADQDPAFDGPIEARNFLRRFMHQLDREVQEIFILSEVHGYTAPEIAQRTGLSPAVIYQRVRQARMQLKRAVMADAQAGERTPLNVPAFAMIGARLGSPGGYALALPWLPSAKTLALMITATVGVAGSVLGTQHVAAKSSPRHLRATPLSAVASPASPRPRIHHPRVESTVRPRVEALPEASPVPSRPLRRTDLLAEEKALLERAQSLIAQERAAEALGVLARHARRFPEGQLWEARERHRIRALCDLGQVQEAHALARAWLRRQPDHPLALQSLHICRGFEPT